MMMTLWAIARSPLILGANLTKLDEWSTRLITNRDVLNLDQTGHDQRQVAREGNSVAWTAAGRSNIRYLALFNLDDKDKSIKHTYRFYNLPNKSYSSRELWSQTDRRRSDGVDVVLHPHECILLELKP